MAENARRVGKYWMGILTSLQQHYALIGDVRGSGLFLGVDLVNDRDSRAPASEQAEYVVNRLRERGFWPGPMGLVTM